MYTVQHQYLYSLRRQKHPETTTHRAKPKAPTSKRAKVRWQNNPTSHPPQKMSTMHAIVWPLQHHSGRLSHAGPLHLQKHNVQSLNAHGPSRFKLLPRSRWGGGTKARRPTHFEYSRRFSVEAHKTPRRQSTQSFHSTYYTSNHTLVVQDHLLCHRMGNTLSERATPQRHPCSTFGPHAEPLLRAPREIESAIYGRAPHARPCFSTYT